MEGQEHRETAGTDERIARIDWCGEVLEVYRRGSAPSKRRRALTEIDLRLLARLALQAGTVALTPRAAWPRLCRSIAMLRRRRHLRKRFPLFRQGAEAVLGPMDDAASVALFDEWRVMLHAQSMAMLQDAIRPASITLHVTGAETLRQNEASEGETPRGAILWASPFAFQGLWGKRALMEAGIRAHQVSSTLHGPSRTRFGGAMVNPFWVLRENRYLAGRLVFDPDEAALVTRRAMRVLSQGGIVIFTNIPFSGTSFARLPFGAAARVSMATTPAALALRHGFALHAVTTLSRAPLQEVELRISPDLTRIVPAEDRRDDRGLAAVLVAVRDIMLEAATERPEEFMGWPALELGTAPAAATRADGV
jgi:hypothetical protein